MIFKSSVINAVVSKSTCDTLALESKQEIDSLLNLISSILYCENFNTLEVDLLDLAILTSIVQDLNSLLK